VNGKEIGDDEFASAQGEVDRVAEKLVGSASCRGIPVLFRNDDCDWVEYFRAPAVDLAVLEVGWRTVDATNVVEPWVSVITDISLDHRNIWEYSGELRGRGGIIRSAER